MLEDIKEGKSLSRRELVVGAGKLAVGTAGIAGIAVLSSEVLKLNLLLAAETKEKPIPVQGQKEPKYPWPWPYKKLDLAKVGEISYNKWFDVFCSQASAHGLMDPLGEMIGEPYISFPIEALIFGVGGTVGWGLTCGGLVTGGLQIGLVMPDRELAARMVNDLMGWYCDTVLPTYKPKIIHPRGADIKNLTRSDTPLCHQSVGRWMAKEGVLFASPQRRDRCARITASVAIKTAEMLNGYIDSGVYKPVYDPQLKLHPMPLRRDVRMPAQNNCSDCHDPFRVMFKAVKHRIDFGVPGGE
jgi:hypothetical protein